MMFLDNLSDSLRSLCAERNLSHEIAAEQCGISTRFFGDIIRKKCSPSLNTLEKLCRGFDKPPNELLRIQPEKSESACASSLSVYDLRNIHPSELEKTLLPLCQKCTDLNCNFHPNASKEK